MELIYSKVEPDRLLHIIHKSDEFYTIEEGHRRDVVGEKEFIRERRWCWRVFLRDFLHNRHVFVFVKNDVASIFVRIGNRFLSQNSVLQIE